MPALAVQMIAKKYPNIPNTKYCYETGFQWICNRICGRFSICKDAIILFNVSIILAVLTSLISLKSRFLSNIPSEIHNSVREDNFFLTCQAYFKLQ